MGHLYLFLFHHVKVVMKDILDDHHPFLFLSSVVLHASLMVLLYRLVHHHLGLHGH